MEQTIDATKQDLNSKKNKKAAKAQEVTKEFAYSKKAKKACKKEVKQAIENTLTPESPSESIVAEDEIPKNHKSSFKTLNLMDIFTFEGTVPGYPTENRLAVKVGNGSAIINITTIAGIKGIVTNGTHFPVKVRIKQKQPVSFVSSFA
jgi:hypothetical protein